MSHVHPPKTPDEISEWQPAHRTDRLDFERIMSAHSRIPWLERMEATYSQGDEGCYICWLLAQYLAGEKAQEELVAEFVRQEERIEKLRSALEKIDKATHDAYDIYTVRAVGNVAREALSSLDKTEVTDG